MAVLLFGFKTLFIITQTSSSKLTVPEFETPEVLFWEVEKLGLQK